MRILMMVWSDKNKQLLRGSHLRDLHPEEPDEKAIAWGQAVVDAIWIEGAVRAELVELTASMMVVLEDGRAEISASGPLRKICDFTR